MDKNTIVIIVIACLALFIWVPAIVWSVRHILKKNNNK